MKRVFWKCVILLALLSTCGCLTGSLPLSNASNAYVDQRLVGEWHASKDSNKSLADRSNWNSEFLKVYYQGRTLLVEDPKTHKTRQAFVRREGAFYYLSDTYPDHEFIYCRYKLDDSIPGVSVFVPMLPSPKLFQKGSGRRPTFSFKAPEGAPCTTQADPEEIMNWFKSLREDDFLAAISYAKESR